MMPTKRAIKRLARPPGRHPMGFTLIEVLISVSILAVLTAMVWVSVSNMFETRDVMTERMERYQVVRLAMNRMADELAAAYLAGPQHGGEEIPGEEMPVGAEGEDAREQRFQQDPVQFGMIGRENRVDFTSFAHIRTLESERASHHAEFGYFLRRQTTDDGRTVQALVRREDTSHDRDLEKGGTIYTMVPEVESIKFEYWDAGEVKIGSAREIAQGRWSSDWDTTRRTHGGRLPMRIRITLTLPAKGPRSRPEIFVTQTTLNTTEVLEF